jgi:catechol 2,3-dioxygenase-like lactoylglutathione lyase family enzyme
MMADSREDSISYIHHVCVIVSDVERSLRFYRDLLGLEVLERVDLIAGKEASLGVGIPNARFELVHLGAKEGPTRLEMLHYFSPESRPLPPEKRSNDIGTAHAAFRVKNIDAYYARLHQSGVQFISEIQESSTGERFCYFYDPDGAILEIIEPPAGPMKSFSSPESDS